MITFKHVTMLPYPVHLNYEQIYKIFTFYSDRADQATMGDRSVWCLHLTGNTLTIAFKRKRDLDQFAQVFQPHASTGSAFARTHHHGSKQSASTGKWLRRDFSSSYMLAFDFLDTEQVGELGAEMSEVADIVTGNDRSAYEVWFHKNKIHIGFQHVEDRDEFADIIVDDEAAAESEIIDEPHQTAASLLPFPVH